MPMRRLLLLLICLAGFTSGPPDGFRAHLHVRPERGNGLLGQSVGRPAVLDASLNITYSCWSTPLDPGTTVLVCPAVGGLDAATGTRSMKAGSSDLKFQLYSDAARSKVAPDAGLSSDPHAIGGGLYGRRQWNLHISLWADREAAGGVRSWRLWHPANIPITLLLSLADPVGTAAWLPAWRWHPDYANEFHGQDQGRQRLCTVDTSPINFGKMAALPQGQDIDATGSLKINCTPNVGYNTPAGQRQSGDRP